MENEKISIIVPCYNVEALIERTVKSICNQTYKNIEIILVNDGSKDNTADIIDKLAGQDSRIKPIHQENGGVTTARLNGVKNATGDWIGFVDGDDLVDEDMFEHLINNAHKYDADISHCGYKMVFPSRIDYYYNTGKVVEQDNLTGLKDLLQGTFIEPGLVNKIFKKQLILDFVLSNKMDMSIKINEDLLMNFYLFNSSKKSIYEDFCPYHYMVRENSTATSKLNENKLHDPLCVLKTINEHLNDISLKQIIDNRIAEQLVTLSTLSLNDQADLIKPYRKSARKELRAMVPILLKGNYGRRIKLLSIWASYFPNTYNLVHALYSRLRGTDKKFEVK